MTGALLATLLASNVLFVAERAPVAMYLVSPPDVTSAAPSAAVYQAAADALVERTGLEVWSMERAGVSPDSIDRCGVESRLSCWTQTMRQAPVRYFWALAVQPLPDGRDRLITIFLDVERSVAIYTRWLDGGEPAWREKAEAEIFAAATVGDAATIRTSDGAALAAYFASTLDDTLKGQLEADAQWRPYGRIEVEVPTPGFTVTVDGRTLGRVEAGALVLQGVLPGEHRVEGRVDAHVSAHDVRVERGGVAQIVFLSPPIVRHPLRTATIYGGAAVAAAGIAVGVWSAVRASDDVAYTCVARPGSSTDCSARGGLTLAYDPGAAPTTVASDVNPSGVVAGALFGGLVTAGAAWALGALWWGEQDRPPWWSWLVGAAVGVTAYGAGHVLVR